VIIRIPKRMRRRRVVWPDATSNAETQGVSALIGAVGGPLLLGLGLFVYFWFKYRYWARRGFHDDHKRRFYDEDWTPKHDPIESEDGLLLKLVTRPGLSIDPRIEIELCVKSGGVWAAVSGRPDVYAQGPTMICCRLELLQPIYESGFYEARWFRRDRGKLVEITRETFQLKNPAFDALARSESRSG
jgi:hypothetical protein